MRVRLPGGQIQNKEAVLPVLYSEGAKKTHIEIFNRGKKPFQYTVTAAQPWVSMSSIKGNITTEERLIVSADFSRAPVGETTVPILIKSTNGTTVKVMAEFINSIHTQAKKGFQEENGYISMEAAHFTRAVSTKAVTWKILPDHGRTLSAVAAYPVTVSIQTLDAESPRLEYQMNLLHAGTIKISTYLSPSLDFSNTKGLFYAISIDDETPQVINMSDTKERSWSTDVSENINIVNSTHLVKTPGVHTLKFWMVSPAVVLQKIVAETRQIPESYLGPPESPLVK